MKKLITLALILSPFVMEAQELKVKSDAVAISFDADMGNTKGSIGGFEATIKFNMDDLASSKIAGTVKTNTLETGNNKRDEHLKTADFFDAEKWPTMEFTSKSFKQDGDKIIMTGIMRIKDIEREETITFSYADKMFKGQGTIQAANYGIYANKPADKTNVKISFAIPVE